jgi:hypothetical protein
MPDITTWNGSVWGTARGTALVEISRDGNQISGRLTLFEPGLGQLQARLKGEWDNASKLNASLDQFTSNYSVQVTLPQTGTLEGKFESSEDLLVGQWKTNLGSGKFLLVKIVGQPVTQAISPIAASPTTSPPVAPALNTKTVVLGSYRIDELALRQLVKLIGDGTQVAVPAINAAVEGREFIHIGVDNLLADPSVPAVVHNITISANEPVINAGTKTVTLNLKKNESNTLFVSGYDRVWVEGKASQIESFLQYHESKATHVLRRYGDNLNSIIFLLMLAFLPSIPSLGDRLKVVPLVFVLLILLMYSWRLAANTKVFLREPKIAWYEQNAGWLLVLLEVSLAAGIGVLIDRFIRR